MFLSFRLALLAGLSESGVKSPPSFDGNRYRDVVTRIIAIQDGLRAQSANGILCIRGLIEKRLDLATGDVERVAVGARAEIAAQALLLSSGQSRGIHLLIIAGNKGYD